mmetsp:Transcript_3843/g.9153  ORF Transcript_3843/g.9153 Transcript_3843/m.9153 type:complete len:232 (-) Transcript_3843:742-1437(-)
MLALVETPRVALAAPVVLAVARHGLAERGARHSVLRGHRHRGNHLHTCAEARLEDPSPAALEGADVHHEASEGKARGYQKDGGPDHDAHHEAQQDQEDQADDEGEEEHHAEGIHCGHHLAEDAGTGVHKPQSLLAGTLEGGGHGLPEHRRDARVHFGDALAQGALCKGHTREGDAVALVVGTYLLRKCREGEIVVDGVLDVRWNARVAGQHVPRELPGLCWGRGVHVAAGA